MRFRFQDVPHFTKTFAIDDQLDERRRADHLRRRLLARTSSSSSSRRGTDLLIVEATLPRPERTGIRGHLTPEEAADHGCRAGVKRVLLTHVSDELDELWVRKCARTQVPTARSRSPSEGAVYEHLSAGSERLYVRRVT